MPPRYPASSTNRHSGSNDPSNSGRRHDSYHRRDTGNGNDYRNRNGSGSGSGYGYGYGNSSSTSPYYEASLPRPAPGSSVLGSMQQHNSSYGRPSPSSQGSSLEQYRRGLAELTFNSKPIIDKLTAMAAERASTMSGPVSRAILDNLVQVHPRMKPASLFLVDSICKNVGEPFVSSFVKHGLVSALVRVIGDVAMSGEEDIKRDLARVFPTWRGLFPQPVLDEIDAKLRPYLTDLPQKTPTASGSRPRWHPETERLLQDLCSLFTRPPGPQVSGIVSEIFKRLSVRPEVKSDLMYELDKKARLPDKRPVLELLQRLLQPTDPPIGTGPPVIKPNVPAPSEPGQAAVQTTDFQLNFPLDFELPDLSILSAILPGVAGGSSALLPVELENVPSKAEPPLHAKDPSLQPVSLSNHDLALSRPGLHRILYTDLPLQCKNCALRYRDTPEGRAELAAHLDTHFRRNMRLKEKSKKVLARDWFCGSAEWIERSSSGVSSDVNGSELAEGTERQVSLFQEEVAGPDADPFEQRKRRKLDASVEDASHVRVPAGDEELLNGDQKRRCQVCQEDLKVEWINEEQQWMYIGAVEIKDQTNNPPHSIIVHKHCAPTEAAPSTVQSPAKRKR